MKEYMDNPGKFKFSKWLRSRTGLVFIAFLVIAAFFLITEHRAHLFGILPYTLLVIALLMFLLTHRWLNGSNTRHGDQPEDKK